MEISPPFFNFFLHFFLGIHVITGAGDVNVTDSRIAFNVGDGMNVSYSGGSTNVTRCTFSSNTGYGIAVWINDTNKPEYLHVHQEIAVGYSEVTNRN